MKRFLVFLLVISVMLLPGCGSSKSEDTRTVLTLDGGGHALLSDAVRLFNASNEDYRVVISEQDPDIVADRSAYDSAALVDIIPYVDADMGRGDILPFLLDGLMEGEALYSLPISWGTVSLGCSKELLDGRTTLTAEEALELLEAMDEGALLFPSWISCGGAPNELAAYLPRYGEEADGYAGESTLLDRVIIYSSAQLAAMLTEPDALWDTGCPGLGPAAGAADSRDGGILHVRRDDVHVETADGGPAEHTSHRDVHGAADGGLPEAGAVSHLYLCVSDGGV